MTAGKRAACSTPGASWRAMSRRRRRRTRRWRSRRWRAATGRRRSPSSCAQLELDGKHRRRARAAGRALPVPGPLRRGPSPRYRNPTIRGGDGRTVERLVKFGSVHRHARWTRAPPSKSWKTKAAASIRKLWIGWRLARRATAGAGAEAGRGGAQDQRHGRPHLLLGRAFSGPRADRRGDGAAHQVAIAGGAVRQRAVADGPPPARSRPLS